MACLAVRVEVMTPVNVVIIEARCVGGLKGAIWNEGSGKWLYVGFVRRHHDRAYR